MVTGSRRCETAPTVTRPLSASALESVSLGSPTPPGQWCPTNRSESSRWSRKSAVRNTLATPSRSRQLFDEAPLRDRPPATNVPGPPTGLTPTVNFIALGFGVGSTRIAIGTANLTRERGSSELMSGALSQTWSSSTATRWSRVGRSPPAPISRRAVAAAVTGGEDDVFLHGTTAATNALLEERGARVGLLTDPGYEDLIEIARQDRPPLYDSLVDRPHPLVPRERRFSSPAEVVD